VAGLGVGGKFAWDATAARRSCPFQAEDVQGVVPWEVDSVQVVYGSDEHPFTLCEYRPAVQEPRTSQSTNRISVTFASTEQGITPGGDCLSGGFWGGRGYACMSGARPNALYNESDAVVTASGGRLVGNNSYSLEARCVAPPDEQGYPTGQERQRCFSEMISFMNALPSRLGVDNDPTVPADELRFDAMVSAAIAAGAPIAPPTAGTPTDGTTPEPSPEPQPEPSPEREPEPTSEPPLIGNPDSPVNDTATFPHFDVSVEGGTKVNMGGEDLVTVQAKVCLTSLTDDATNGSTRISWDPWSAETRDGDIVKPVSFHGSSDAFPKESRAKPGECVEGTLAFQASGLASVTYVNGQGDSYTFVP
jgi:hypothetical protein